MPRARLRYGSKLIMTSHTLFFVLGGCLLGLIQLAVGVAIGMRLRPANSSTAGNGKHDLMQASLIAKRLQDLADEMSSSVGEHRSKLDQASHLLTSGGHTDDESLTALVV